MQNTTNNAGWLIFRGLSTIEERFSDNVHAFNLFDFIKETLAKSFGRIIAADSLILCGVYNLKRA